jgi:prephenate dehydrogenase
MVASGDRDSLLGVLQSARAARRNLPTGLPVDEHLVEFRVPIEDRPGALAQVLTLATELGVNVADLEIAHSLEGRSGVLVLVVSNDADAFEEALLGHGYHVARASMS